MCIQDELAILLRKHCLGERFFSLSSEPSIVLSYGEADQIHQPSCFSRWSGNDSVKFIQDPGHTRSRTDEG